MPEHYQMYIDGALVDAKSGQTLETVNPFTGEAWATFPEGAQEDLDLAVAAAKRASEDRSWSHNPARRATLINKLADALEEKADFLASIESRDNGKTIREETGMNRAVPRWYRLAAATADTELGEIPSGADPNVVALTTREPWGVVGIQTPWNTPGVLLAQMASMALAAGNTVVIKPSEVAPASILELAKIVHEVGFPAGVFNVVTGLGPVVGAAMASHPDVDKLTMTGSPAAGRIVAGEGAKRLVPAVMELGGKSANLVFADADLEAAANGIYHGFMGAGGQSCVAGTRAIVHRSVYDQLVERIVELVGTTVIGDPSDPATDMGPLPMQLQVDRIQEYVEAGVAEGARLAGGGRTAEHDGTLFFPPVVFADVDPSMSIAREEIFGPVLSVIPFDTEDEAVRINNDSVFGLAAGVWTQNLDQAHRVSRRIKAGTVWVNHYRRGDAAFPFGGFGESGYGRVNGREGYREMSRTKSVQILLTPAVD